VPAAWALGERDPDRRSAGTDITGGCGGRGGDRAEMKPHAGTGVLRFRDDV
jgi:hypothetical protein